jgi:hypothetical protein
LSLNCGNDGETCPDTRVAINEGIVGYDVLPCFRRALFICLREHELGSLLGYVQGYGSANIGIDAYQVNISSIDHGSQGQGRMWNMKTPKIKAMRRTEGVPVISTK